MCPFIRCPGTPPGVLKITGSGLVWKMNNISISGLAEGAAHRQGGRVGMNKAKTKAYCRYCRHEQVFVRATMRHGWHLVFSIVTLGLWAVCWLALHIGQRMRPWQCEHCRCDQPDFRSLEKRTAEVAGEKRGRRKRVRKSSS